MGVTSKFSVINLIFKWCYIVSLIIDKILKFDVHITLKDGEILLWYSWASRVARDGYSINGLGIIAYWKMREFEVICNYLLFVAVVRQKFHKIWLWTTSSCWSIGFRRSKLRQNLLHHRKTYSLIDESRVVCSSGVNICFMSITPSCN